MVQMGSFEINIHFAGIYNSPLFTSKPTFARIDYLQQGGRLVDEKGTQNVKICTKNLTRLLVDELISW